MMTEQEFSKLLPEGWEVELYDLTESRDDHDVIQVTKKGHMLTLTRQTCEGDTILEADYFEYNDCGYDYLDTLLGEYTWPEYLPTGEAQQWFANVVREFENDNFNGVSA